MVPFVRIGGILRSPTSMLRRVQTDGTFGSRHGARIAALLFSDNQGLMIPLHHCRDSTEAEWASVAFGLRYALANDLTEIGLENDNQGVIHGLIQPYPQLKHAYARYYRDMIVGLSRESEWTGVRWIPRQLNRADGLFR